jgi:hypothetical protein
VGLRQDIYVYVPVIFYVGFFLREDTIIYYFIKHILCCEGKKKRGRGKKKYIYDFIKSNNNMVIKNIIRVSERYFVGILI